MNIYIELNKIVEYIENHLEEKIDYKEISKMNFNSTFQGQVNLFALEEN